MQKRLLFFITLIFASTSLFAQRVNYTNLLNRANAPQIFIDDIVLPSEDGKAILSFIFRFDNDFLPFKKVSLKEGIKAPSEMDFYTIARLNAEIFNGKLSRRNKSYDTISRDIWTDTLFTKTFEDTESKKRYASGSLSNALEPGDYNFVLQLSLMESVNERSSNRQNVKIWDWNTKPTGEILLIKEKNQSNDLTLMNMDDNVMFGKDFTTLIRIPNYNDQQEYTISISEARFGRKDTTKTRTVYTKTISKQDIQQNVVPVLSKGIEPMISMKETSQNYTYAIVSIPNSTFENSAYMMEVISSDSKKPLAKRIFRSYWQNMPASLLNLDVALNMMKFIIDEEQLKSLKSGNTAEKEKKFREFWASKDPTPETVYNELMAEYFRRIDYAFKEFGNQGNLEGHESDQGEVYIKFGPPDSKDRRFPTNGNVVEIWNYKNRQFIFEASTGFGDFVLKAAE